ncbi:MAG: hypothetical protein JW795_05670, partial [Chitinivibrionales bacterium]|nr:hypothetical protein [Chitinivibrionales bacterium]
MKRKKLALPMASALAAIVVYLCTAVAAVPTAGVYSSLCQQAADSSFVQLFSANGPLNRFVLCGPFACNHLGVQTMHGSDSLDRPIMPDSCLMTDCLSTWLGEGQLFSYTTFRNLLCLPDTARPPVRTTPEGAGLSGFWTDTGARAGGPQCWYAATFVEA